MPQNHAQNWNNDALLKLGSLRLGLAGRVIALAGVAVLLATLAQWAITPFMLGREVKAQQTESLQSIIKTFEDVGGIVAGHGSPDEFQEIAAAYAKILPGGTVTIYTPDEFVIAHAGVEPTAQAFEQITGNLGTLIENEHGQSLAVALYHHGELAGYARYARKGVNLPAMAAGLWWRNSLILVFAMVIMLPILLPIARSVLKPVARLEDRIRRRTEFDKSRLSDNEQDSLLKPLLTAIDEAYARSDAATSRAMRLAYADPVTQLPNRLHILAKLDQLVNRANPIPVFFVVCDLDNFRRLNVELGPRSADEALNKVGQRLKKVAQSMAPQRVVVGRLGADQFGFLAPNVDGDVVMDLIDRANKALDEPMTVDDAPHKITACFGAAKAPDDATHAADLVKKAEVALKEAKQSKETNGILFNTGLLTKARERGRLEASMREGLEYGEFVAVFQPKVRLDTGELVGAEALARWKKPDGSIVSPGVFIPIAEELGLVAKLGESVMYDACMAAAKWNKSGPATRIAVNVSPYQFDDPNFVDSVERALSESGLDPHLLELEITESSAVQDPDRVARIMWPLRERGVRMAIDDFGTGHSNFSSITRLPFDVFKIDQQFIRGLDKDPNAPTIVEMIIAMAESLGQETVAEGIETREQADFLLNRACTIGQGYYFSPPLPEEEFEAFKRSWRPKHLRRFVA